FGEHTLSWIESEEQSEIAMNQDERAGSRVSFHRDTRRNEERSDEDHSFTNDHYADEPLRRSKRKINLPRRYVQCTYEESRCNVGAIFHEAGCEAGRQNRRRPVR